MRSSSSRCKPSSHSTRVHRSLVDDEADSQTEYSDHSSESAFDDVYDRQERARNAYRLAHISNVNGINGINGSSRWRRRSRVRRCCFCTTKCANLVRESVRDTLLVVGLFLIAFTTMKPAQQAVVASAVHRVVNWTSAFSFSSASPPPPPPSFAHPFVSNSQRVLPAGGRASLAATPKTEE